MDTTSDVLMDKLIKVLYRMGRIRTKKWAQLVRDEKWDQSGGRPFNAMILIKNYFNQNHGIKLSKRNI